LTRCVFLGDAHITPEDKEFQLRFSNFLRSLDGQADHLFIMGDLFEFWFGFKEYSFQSEYGVVLDALRYLVSRGMRLIYFEGNHDFNMGPVFSGELQATVYPDAHHFEVDGHRWFVTHGDLASAQGFRYRTYRKLIRNHLTYGLIMFLGPRILLRVADKLGALSHHVYHTPQAYKPKRYSSYIKEQFSKGYDVVIMGHTHRAEIREQKVTGRSCLYVNCGDVKKKETYVTFSPENGFEIKKGLIPCSDNTPMPPI